MPARVRSPRAAGQVSWDNVLNRAIRLGAAWIMAVQVIFAVLAAFAVDAGVALGVIGVVIACQLTLIGLSLAAAWRSPRSWVAPAGLAVGVCGVVAGASLDWVTDDLPRSLELMIPASALQALQFFVVAMTTRMRTGILAILLAGVGYFALRLPTGLTGEDVEQWAGSATATLALVLVLSYLRAGSAHAHQLDEWNRSARRAEVAATSAHLALSHSRRVIHDDVISALRAVEQDVPAEAAARTALASLREPESIRSRRQLLDQLTQDSPVRVEVIDDGWPVEPPDRVLDAMLGAGREALRNVARHSGQQSAAVHARADADRVLLLEIRDHGRGLAGRGGGFGVQHSIVDRLGEVGGSATCTDAAEGGVLVRLAWAAPPPPRDEWITPYSTDNRLRGYLPVALVLGLNSTILAVRHDGGHSGASLALALAMLLAQAVVAWRLAIRPATGAEAVVVAGVVCVGTAAGLWLAGDGALLDYRSWIVGMGTTLLLLLAFDAPLVQVVAAVAAQEAVMVWFAWRDPQITVFEPVGSLSTPVVVCGLGFGLGALLRYGTRLMRRSEAMLAAQLDDQAWLEAQIHARRVHLAHLRDEVGPVLTAVAEGEAVDRGQVAALSARCRDRLLLGRALPDDLRSAVDAARARGSQVTFRSVDDRAGWPAGLDTTLLALLRVAPTSIVTVFPADGPRVVVVSALGGRERRSLARDLGDAAVLDDAELRTIVRLSPDAPTPVTSEARLSLDA